MSKNAIKVLIIGLDGATWDIIDGLVKNNELPTFKKLIYDGVKAKLYSTQPNLTPIAWSSFLTGKNPGNHGIYDFFKYENKKATPVNSKMLKGDLWEVLGKRGKKIISLDVALTYPPKKVNGIVVSGFPVVDLDSNFIYPSRIKNKLDIHLMNKLGHKYYPTPGDFSGNIKTLKGFIKSHYDFTD